MYLCVVPDDVPAEEEVREDERTGEAGGEGGLIYLEFKYLIKLIMLIIFVSSNQIQNTDIGTTYSTRTNLEHSMDWERTLATCATQPLGTPPSGPR